MLCLCVGLLGYTWLLLWAVSDSTLLPGRSQSFSPKCLSLQAAAWPSPFRNTHIQIVMVCRSHDLTAFPFLSVRLILLLWFFHHFPPHCFYFPLSLTSMAIKSTSTASPGGYRSEINYSVIQIEPVAPYFCISDVLYVSSCGVASASWTFPCSLMSIKRKILTGDSGCM